MADISAWSPIDESNTSAPPDGWPEFMANSMVNNSARAMMGAVRRWYDEVLDGSLALPYLPTTGGGMTGGLTVNSVAGISTIGGITASGNILGGSLSSLGAVSASGTVTAGGLVSTGNISASNNATITGTAQVGALVSTGNISTAGGTITGALISSAGGISATGTVNAAQYNIAGLTLVTSVGSATSIFDGSGAPNIVLDSGGNNFYRGVTHSFMNRPATISYAIFNSIGTYNASGFWLHPISDDAVKTDVQPYARGLAELRRLTPVSFVDDDAVFPDAPGTIRYGLLASEAAGVVPEMVGEAEFEVDGVPTLTRTLQPGHLVYLLINGCKTLADRLETLEAQISAAR